MIAIENKNKLEKDNSQFYFGEIRCIISKKESTPYGFICNHNYTIDGYERDIFFSFKEISTKDKLESGDSVEFIVAKDETSGRIWAMRVKKKEENQDE